MQYGRFADAIAAYQQAITLDPNFATPHNGLGTVYRANGRSAEAIAAYQKAIDLNPNEAMYHSNLGLVYSDNGRYEEAIDAFQKAIALDPNDALPQTSLTACYRKLGREAEYATQVKLARELIANESEYNRACFEAICGNVAEAVALLKQAIVKAPNDRQLAQTDPDFDFIRDDPRFQAVVNPAAAAS